MVKLALIFVGSGLGGTCRYGLGALVYRLSGSTFPYGTLIVNLLGCLLAGFLAALFAGQPLREEIRITLTVGFLGGFTTFSAFGLDTLNLAQQGHHAKAATYVLASVLGGLHCAWLGFRIGNTFFVNS